MDPTRDPDIFLSGVQGWYLNFFFVAKIKSKKEVADSRIPYLVQVDPVGPNTYGSGFRSPTLGTEITSYLVAQRVDGLIGASVRKLGHHLEVT